MVDFRCEPTFEDDVKDILSELWLRPSLYATTDDHLDCLEEYFNCASEDADDKDRERRLARIKRARVQHRMLEREVRETCSKFGVKGLEVGCDIRASLLELCALQQLNVLYNEMAAQRSQRWTHQAAQKSFNQVLYHLTHFRSAGARSVEAGLQSWVDRQLGAQH